MIPTRRAKIRAAMMDRRVFLGALASGLLAAPLPAGAQQARAYRIGVILQGGPYSGAIHGLRDRLQFVINLKTAKVLGLTIPPSLLQRANQVIE